ncbi:Nucleoid occlusion protein [subsurface metagenome]
MKDLREIEIDLVDDPKYALREKIDMRGIDELVTSIENTGLIQPITVFKNRNRYEVAVGHRRLIACKIAKMEKIPAIITDVDPEKIDVMKLDENIFREDLSPVLIAKYIYRIMKEKALSTIEIARYFGKTPQWVNTMLRLLDTDEYTQEAVSSGELSYAGALELQKIDDHDTRSALTQAAVKGGAHTRVIKGWVNDYRNDKEDREDYQEEHGETDEQSEPRTYQRKCICCQMLTSSEGIITIEVCPECYPIIKRMTKSYREG